MKLATPMGATSGNSVQVSLPAVVSMMAVGRAGVVVAGLAAAAAAGFFAGAAFGVVCAAGAVWDHPAEHAAASSKQIEKHFLMDAPGRRALPGRAGDDTCPYMVCGDCEI
jgi:hypothetical protein